VVHREGGDDEVERSRRKLVLEPLQPQVGVREPLARPPEHGSARVEADPGRSGMPRSHEQRGLAGAGPELEHPGSIDALGRRHDGLLQLFVAGNLVGHLCEIAVRIPLPLGHGLHHRRIERVKLGLSLGYAPPGTNPADLFPLVQEAERLGFDSVWVAEAWGTDAVSVLGWLAARTDRIKLGSAIMQIPGRTPANAAMTAATLDLLSGGRFLLGLGTSGPQVVEGWHGQPWGKPLGKTREYVEIVRAALRREVVEHDGEHYGIPYDGPGATGLGKPLKLMLRPLRAEIPIYLAALGPKNVSLAAEIADGWLPIFVAPERFDQAFGPSLAAAPPDFEIAATASVFVGDDVAALRDALRPHLALYVGGMGAKGRNFYNSLMRRYGWEDEAERIQDLYLGGKQREAIAAVPDELVDAVSLIGPKERIAERLEAWRETPVTTLVLGTTQPEALQTLAELVL